MVSMNEPLNRPDHVGPWVDIDLNALIANFEYLKSSAPGAETAAVVKCDAYGLGLEAIAQKLADHSCQTFFVAYPQEGALLRKAISAINESVKIYVLNGPHQDSLAKFKEARLTPVLNSLEQVRIWTNAMGSTPVALHVDTGMNRLGAPIDELGDIGATPDLSVELIMSHLAFGAAPDNAMNAAQLQRFIEVSARFPAARKSLSASAGALMDAGYHFDLIRAGIALYGGSPFHNDEPRLRSVAALRAPIIQIRSIGRSETVGYNAAFTAQRPSRLATVALGYGDGFPTSGSGRAAADIGGVRAPIAGRISMDLISLDVTEADPAVKTGDSAAFFGKSISLFEAAKSCNTIPYELLTSLGARVVRRYV